MDSGNVGLSSFVFESEVEGPWSVVPDPTQKGKAEEIVGGVGSCTTLSKV